MANLLIGLLSITLWLLIVASAFTQSAVAGLIAIGVGLSLFAVGRRLDTKP